MRAQAAMEMMSLFALGGLMVITATLMSLWYTEFADEQKRASIGNEVCLLLAQQVNSAAAFGDGFQTSFTLPTYVSQYFFDVTFDDSERRVRVAWSDGTCQQPVLSNVTGNLSAGVNTLRVEYDVVYLNS